MKTDALAGHRVLFSSRSMFFFGTLHLGPHRRDICAPSLNHFVTSGRHKTWTESPEDVHTTSRASYEGLINIQIRSFDAGMTLNYAKLRPLDHILKLHTKCTANTLDKHCENQFLVEFRRSWNARPFGSCTNVLCIFNLVCLSNGFKQSSIRVCTKTMAVMNNFQTYNIFTISHTSLWNSIHFNRKNI